MKADPKDQRRLLDLQAIDTGLAQLAHRRRTLPEHAELESLTREIAELEDERVRAQVTVDDLDRDIRRLERDVEQVRLRKERDEARLTMGTGPARELEALQHELVSLNRRQNELEDAQLELMEQREAAQGVLDEVLGLARCRRTGGTRSPRAPVRAQRPARAGVAPTRLPSTHPPTQHDDAGARIVGGGAGSVRGRRRPGRARVLRYP